MNLWELLAFLSHIVSDGLLLSAFLPLVLPLLLSAEPSLDLIVIGVLRLNVLLVTWRVLGSAFSWPLLLRMLALRVVVATLFGLLLSLSLVSAFTSVSHT